MNDVKNIPGNVKLENEQRLWKDLWIELVRNKITVTDIREYMSKFTYFILQSMECFKIVTGQIHV